MCLKRMHELKMIVELYFGYFHGICAATRSVVFTRFILVFSSTSWKKNCLNRCRRLLRMALCTFLTNAYSRTFLDSMFTHRKERLNFSVPLTIYLEKILKWSIVDDNKWIVHDKIRREINEALTTKTI